MYVYISMYVYFMFMYETVKTVPLKMYMCVQGSKAAGHAQPRVSLKPV